MNAVSTTKSRNEKLRKPVSFIIAIVFLAFLIGTKSKNFDTPFYEALELTGFCFIFIAAIGRIWCTLYIAGRKNKILCSEGPYSMCRNPLYLFSFAGLLGICLAGQNIILTLVAVPIYLICYHFVIEAEEERLQRVFGDKFTNYISSTPRFWPRLSIPRDHQILEVDTKIFTRSLREIIWFLLAIILIEVIEVLKSGGITPCYLLPF
jgi:protein-S-isoprenylcysteine O-methyltransferase Ste14